MSLTSPCIAVNRINTPKTAEEVLEKGYSDLVSLARPLLADSDFVNKAAEQKKMKLMFVLLVIRRASTTLLKEK